MREEQSASGYVPLAWRAGSSCHVVEHGLLIFFKHPFKSASGSHREPHVTLYTTPTYATTLCNLTCYPSPNLWLTYREKGLSPARDRSHTERFDSRCST